MVEYTFFEAEAISHGLTFTKGEGLSSHTTIGVGGSASYFFTPASVVELIKIKELAQKHGVASAVLGNGSNTLVSDGGFSGAVISTKGLDEVYVERCGDAHVYVRAFCGVTLKRLVDFCVRNGLGGLEFLYGIPGSVGGAVYMNAGRCGRAIGDAITSVFKADGNKTLLLSGEECAFDYRKSIFQVTPSVIISALFRTKIEKIDVIKQKLRAYGEIRSRQPNGKSLGSVFKNGEIPAGKAIDACGLKGLRVGGACVSEEHANFIINDGKASATDVYCLIKTVKATVKERLGLTLNEEIKYLGEFL